MQKGETGQSNWISIGILTPKILMLSMDLEIKDSNDQMYHWIDYIHTIHAYVIILLVKYKFFID